MRFPNLSECMGIEQAMEGKGGNCGFMHLPTKLPVHLKLPDFCSLKCWRTDCQQVVLFHLNSSLLRGRSQCGTSYFFIRYFFIKGCVLGNPLFHCRLGRCVAEGTSSQSFSVKSFPSCFIVFLLCVVVFFFPASILTLNVIINYYSPSCLVLSLPLQNLFCLIPFLSSSG